MSDDFAFVHRDGVPWWEAPLPRWLHRCRPQTTAFVDGRMVERCACGATRERRGWWGRNETRIHRLRERTSP